MSLKLCFLSRLVCRRPSSSPRSFAAAAFATTSRTLLAPNMASSEPTPYAPGTTKIGWIGVGVMGTSMAGHLLAAGYQVNVFSRTASKVDSLVAKGAVLCASPAAVAAASDIVFSMVGFPHDVRQVILGDNGVLSGLKAGGVLCDMTTSEPSLAVEIDAAAAARGIAALDAPVSGGDIGARNATLSIMVGASDAAAFERLRPVLGVMGKTITHLGGAGAGQHTKMVNQILISSAMIGVCEGLLYGHKAGLDLTTVIAAVGSGAAGSWSINNLGPRIVARNFNPGFFVEHFIKDMGIALAEAQRMNLSLPGLALAHQMYTAVKAQGNGRLGTHALSLALEKLNNVEFPKKL
jgi:3-hydroxyisobutyrate dehydrogenase